MKRIVAPTRSYLDWKPLLAQPDRQWKAGHSAMAIAQCWEAADPGFPPEVTEAFRASNEPVLQNLEILLAIPEYEVALEGGSRPSHTDLFVIAHNHAGVVCIAVEGKVDEPFGPTLADKRKELDGGVPKRLSQLHQTLGLQEDLPGAVRYQLLHRTASALLGAEQFSASAAVMLVHSFSEEDTWFTDFVEFSRHLGVIAKVGAISAARGRGTRPLFVGWCHGSERFLSDLSQNAA